MENMEYDMIIVFIVILGLGIIFGEKTFMILTGFFLLLFGIEFVFKGLTEYTEAKLKIIGFSLIVIGFLTIFLTQFFGLALFATGIFACIKVLIIWLIIIERRYCDMG